MIIEIDLAYLIIILIINSASKMNCNEEKLVKTIQKMKKSKDEEQIFNDSSQNIQGVVGTWNFKFYDIVIINNNFLNL